MKPETETELLITCCKLIDLINKYIPPPTYPESKFFSKYYLIQDYTNLCLGDKYNLDTIYLNKYKLSYWWSILLATDFINDKPNLYEIENWQSLICSELLFKIIRQPLDSPIITSELDPKYNETFLFTDFWSKLTHLENTDTLDKLLIDLDWQYVDDSFLYEYYTIKFICDRRDFIVKN